MVGRVLKQPSISEIVEEFWNQESSRRLGAHVPFKQYRVGKAKNSVNYCKRGIEYHTNFFEVGKVPLALPATILSVPILFLHKSAQGQKEGRKPHGQANLFFSLLQNCSTHSEIRFIRQSLMRAE